MSSYDRSAIMKRAWVIYHANRRIGRAFDRKLFGQSLAAAWGERKRFVEWKAREANPLPVMPERAMSPMEAAIDAVKYLPSHMSAARAEARIRAAYASHA